MKKEITMKTLLKITNGGSIGLYIVFVLILAGCSFSFPLLHTTFYIHGQQFKVSVICTDHLTMYIQSDKDFVVYPDSLRIEFSHDNLSLQVRQYKVDVVRERGYYPAAKEEPIDSNMSAYDINRNRDRQYLKIKFYIAGNVDIRDAQHPLYMNVLPSGYIICQGESVIKDTLKIKITQENMHWLKRPLYKPVTKTKTAKALERMAEK